MTNRLEERIRRYAEAADAAAPSVEELLQGALAARLGVDRPDAADSLPQAPLTSKGLPRWVAAPVAAIVVLIALVPVWLWMNGPGRDAVDNTLPTIPAPVQPQGPLLSYNLWDQTVEGSGWLPDTQMEASLAGVDLSATTDSDGRFALVAFSECCVVDPLLEISDGATSRRVAIPWLGITRFDPDSDVIAGETESAREVQLRILDGGEPVYETVVTPSDGGWFVDLAGVYDLAASMRVEAWVQYPDVRVLTESPPAIAPEIGVRPDRGEIEGRGWAPQSLVAVTMDGVALAKPTSTDAAGSFRLQADDHGFNIETGTSITVTDGMSIRTIVVPDLTFDSLDPFGGTASGTADLPDGTGIQVELWFAIVGADGPDRRDLLETVVSNGRWEVEFDLPDGGRTVFEAVAIVDVDSAWIQVHPGSG